jgi:peptide/nickel transport system permease protein
MSDQLQRIGVVEKAVTVWARTIGRFATAALGGRASESVDDGSRSFLSRFFRHRGALAGAVILGVLVLGALLAPLSPYDPIASNMAERFQPPSWRHPFGTDALGRDLLTRVLYGGRVSLSVGALVVVVTLLIGVPMGAAAGYFGGWIDGILMRITDAVLTLPTLFVLILLGAILSESNSPVYARNNVLIVALVIGLLSWMTVARLTRATFLSTRSAEFVTAAHSIGVPGPRVMVRHILPAAVGPITVEATLEVAYAILEESGLSFLGFGIQPPTPSWGNLLGSAQEHLVRYPWLAIFPGLMILLTVVSINFIGDGLRDAFDPRSR